MTNFEDLEQRLSTALALTTRPVAVAFRDAAPGVTRFVGSEPSGCSFWRLASEGRTFYTVPDDHYNCPIGSYTHNIPLPASRAAELEQALELMATIGYIRMEEVPQISRLAKTPGVVIYAPLAQTPTDPDVVLFAGRPGRLMLLQEAAQRAGVAAPSPLMGRPTCMALPAALVQGAVASLGCIGNRVYTGLDEAELYVAVPGKDLTPVADAVDTIVSANTQLTQYHQDRRQTLRREGHAL